ncbi:hypothetical protein BJ1_gp67 [Halorubrum virus BJ1]|uniref:Fibronectin type-III domain-containing protein n=1 Tax=Halorubrum virus BJ1 TaxID=416419 RepID=A0ZYT0_9CAUD|nr:hypothetical protein BJ1_gp67 [Halorubrum virus BJ1]CAL92489.1 hypothetical protein [Halorubrum virus BJ1]
MPVTLTTTLPDEDQPVLGNGVEDEIAVDRETATTNNGSIRIQARETGESSWDATATGFVEQTAAYDTLTPIITGREDGEEYEVRVRSETDYRIGAWTDPVAIIAKFPGAASLVATVLSATEVELTWTDHADNETGQYVVRERRVDGEWWPEQIVDDAGPNTESYVDDTVPPDTEVRYRIRAYTEHTSADSNTDTATTDGIGLSRTRVPASGWRVELVDDEGTVLTPTVLEGATPKSTLNDFPRVEIPVPRSDRWRDESLERAEMRVWRDGERLPIERFERPVQEPERTILHGRGGVELDEDVEIDVGELRDVHDRTEQLIDEETPYLSHVDDPANDIRGDVPMADADSLSTFTELFDEIDDTDGNEVPVGLDVEPSRLQTEQVVWLQSGENAATKSQLTASNEPYWDDRAYRLQEVGDTLSWEFDVEHEVSIDDLALRIRKEQPVEGESPEIEFRLDGTVIETLPADLDGQGGDAAPTWSSVFIDDVSSFDPGSHTFTAEVTGSSSSDGEWIVDGFGAHDEAYPADWSLGDGADGVENGVIQGPGIYPQSVQITTTDQEAIEQIVGGRLTVDANNTAGNFAVAVSNDAGETWIEELNAEEVVGEFADGSTQLRGRVTLSRYDQNASTSPAIGDGRQELTLVELFADLDDTPFLQGAALSGTVMEVLQQLADNHNFVFELAWDSDQETIAVEWTQPGQRSASTSAAVLDYETEVDAETVVEETLVYGRSQRLRDVEVALSTDIYEDIGDDYIQPGSVQVRDPDTDTEYQIGDDYTVLHNEGVIKATSSGAISDGQTVLVDAETRIAAEYTLPGADGSGDRIRRTVEAASTRQLAEQAALAITRELSEPLEGATVTLDREADGLVGALDIEGAPIDPEVVREIETSASEVQVRLGSRESAGEVVDDISRRVESVVSRL